MNVAEIDAAFDRSERQIIGMGKDVVARITEEFRAGRINAAGVQDRVALALKQIRSLPADQVPTAFCRLLEIVLRQTIVEGLKAAGIPGAELPA